jgi:hypothetical protein
MRPSGSGRPLAWPWCSLAPAHSDSLPSHHKSLCPSRGLTRESVATQLHAQARFTFPSPWPGLWMTLSLGVQAQSIGGGTQGRVVRAHRLGWAFAKVDQAPQPRRRAHRSDQVPCQSRDLATGACRTMQENKVPNCQMGGHEPHTTIKDHWAPVAHTYNPSYSGGRDQEDHGSKPARANSS